MKQLPLPGMSAEEKIVNVASVPHRSPFRYPGGKTWLVPHIRRWLAAQQKPPTHFIEPFAGGGIVGLTVSFESLAEQTILVELDEQVAAVWQTILETDDGQWLAQQILDFDLTTENVKHLFSLSNISIRERALQTIVKNRVNRGGILAKGAGMLKNGENGRGISSRWYPKTLSRRILDIVRIRERLTFLHEDGSDTIIRYAHQSNTCFFIDPPYTASVKKPGSRLYDHFEVDHEGLFALVSDVRGDILMTYDNDPYVRHLAEKHFLQWRPIHMKNTHHSKRTELLIGRNLRWTR